MKVISLVDNITETELKAKHGLSFYIETHSHKILFDLGPDDTFLKNAIKRNIDISKVDTVIISHGHIDHGGGLKAFLEINSEANIYVQKNAFNSHYIKVLFIKLPVGIDAKYKSHKQIKLIDGDYRIDDELFLFTVDDKSEFYSSANDSLYDNQGKDEFGHEQNLIISENKISLFMGCGHSGVINIMEKAKQYKPEYCFGGFHLFNPITKKTIPNEALNELAKNLQKYSETKFYTCHCTGKKVFEYLANIIDNLDYYYCGKELSI